MRMSEKRDLAADLAWVNDPDVCLSPRVREICDHAIRRAQEAEAENARLLEVLESLIRKGGLDADQGQLC